MIGPDTEYPATLTAGMADRKCACLLCQDPRAQGLRSRQRSVQKKRESSKFPRAFLKALKVRSHVLGRRLDKLEWTRLRDAVRKQVSRHVSPVTKELASLATRVSRLELSRPTDLQQVSDAVALLQLQTQILQRQIYLATEEKQSLTESCSHLTNKTKIMLDPTARKDLYVDLPGVGKFIAKAPNTVSTVCEACRMAREDTVFGWSGTELQWSNIDVTGFVEIKRLQTRQPLAYQFVWSSILDEKFSRIE